jgi:hypothetical protein
MAEHTAWEAITVDGREPVTGHAFISYAREDSGQVDRLERALREAGIPVWRDTSDLWPGEDWRAKIRAAITDGALAFIACFSSRSTGRAKGYQYEELALAVEEARLRPPGAVWLIPVRFDDCLVPDVYIGGGRTLSGIHRVDLFGDAFDRESARLVEAVGRIFRPLQPGWVGSRLSPVAVRPVSLSRRPAALAAREDLLAGLHATLSQGPNDSPQLVVLHGMGGIGKTSVAVEYAYRHQAAMAVAWQFPAEDPVVLAGEFARLAAVLGAAGALDRQDPVAVVHARLAGSASPWLLVFDNAPDEVAVRRFLPPAGGGRVLITSQSSLWPRGQGMQVRVLNPEQAAEFLMTRTGSTDLRSASGLAGQLGGLPLALEQAAAYVLASGASLAEYLGQFRERRGELLSRGEPAGYDKTVATTWSLAFTRLEQQAPAATSLLRLLACCAPEPVPLTHLLKPPMPPDIPAVVAGDLSALIGDPLAVWDAVAALGRYSLVTPSGDGLVTMHRLVQAVTVDQMPADLALAWASAAGRLIDAALPDDAVTPDCLPVLRSVLPHAQVVLPDDSEGMLRMASTLGRSGGYRAARDLCYKIVQARERVLGAEHRGTVTARHDLAHWTGFAGDPAAARDQFADLLPISRRVYGAEDRHTLTTWHSLGYWTGESGDTASARDMLAELVPVRRQVFGPDDPDSLNDRHDLACLTGEAGQPEAARDQLAVLLADMKRLLRPEHQDILTARHDLACWTWKAGDGSAARDQLAALLPDMERWRGPEHPDTLLARHDLACWTGRAGDAVAARDQLAGLIPYMQRVLGPEHPKTLIASDSLALWTRAAE